MAGSRIYTVSQLNQEIKNLLESNPSFLNLFVRGEISNYKAHPSGHHYMTIKDEGAAISAVLFRSDAAKLRFRLSNGLKVVARGRISSFPKSGQVQLYLADLMPEGAGSLHLEFEQRKEKLYQEGLFDVSHKQSIPAYPEHIAIITSPSGAAIQDMLRILKRRWPLAEVTVFPATVQGPSAPRELIAALQAANAQGKADVILLGRGGGSMEDLWGFNDEALARAIYHSAIPVISAVGHEPDVTIADFVADLRAPTPSGGAELAVPDRNDVMASVRRLDKRLQTAFECHIDRHRSQLTLQMHRLESHAPIRYVMNRRQAVDSLQNRLRQVMRNTLQENNLAVDWAAQQLQHAITHRMEKARAQYQHHTALLDAYSPLKILSRGYSVALDTTGKAVTNAAALSIGDRLTVCFEKGQAHCRIQEIVKSEEQIHGNQKEIDV